MKKKITNILTTILLGFFICISNVSADAKIVDRVDIKIDDKTVYKMYDNTSNGKTDIVGATGAVVKVSIDGVEYDGYCIDFGITISSGTTANTLDLYDYYKDVLGESAATALVRKIVLYAKFGYGSSGKTSPKYYLATQQLIWEAINNTGFYETDFYKQRAGKKFNIQNLGWTTDKETKIDISPEISAIKSAVNNYYTTPSFCSSQNKLEIEIGKTVEYTDNNNVLSSYEVTCENGLTCTTNGNKLSITAKDEAGNKQITFLKPSTGTDNVIYRADGQQGIVVNRGILESVSCEFGVDTFKNEKTADMQIIYIVVIGLFCGTMSYITYYTKRSLDRMN